jgi:malic enzyme
MTLTEICQGADALIGISVADAFTEEVLNGLNPDPVIFAMANPELEVKPEVAKQLRPDCIIATGRSDYPNQINTDMCLPFLFRATLDSRSKQINEQMKMAAAIALAGLAKEPMSLLVSQLLMLSRKKFLTDLTQIQLFSLWLTQSLKLNQKSPSNLDQIALLPLEDLTIQIKLTQTCAYHSCSEPL